MRTQATFLASGLYSQENRNVPSDSIFHPRPHWSVECSNLYLRPDSISVDRVLTVCICEKTDHVVLKLKFCKTDWKVIIVWPIITFKLGAWQQLYDNREWCRYQHCFWWCILPIRCQAGLPWPKIIGGLSGIIICITPLEFPNPVCCVPSLTTKLTASGECKWAPLRCVSSPMYRDDDIHPSPKVMADFFRHKNQHNALIQFAQFLVDLWSVW